MRLKTELSKRICEVCGNEFIPKTIKSMTCSPNCTKIASKRRKRMKEEILKLKEKADSISPEQEFLTVPQAALLFSVNKVSLYKIIKQGKIPALNLGKRMIRVKRSDLETMFTKRELTITQEKTQPKKLYSMEPEDCYTIGEIQEKFNISEKTVYSQIRSKSIPTRQIGKYVYAPKEDIDELFK